MDNLIARMFAKDGIVICPYCHERTPESNDIEDEGDYVAIQKPLYFSGGDNYSAEKAFNMGVRGDVIALPCKGECGHQWTLVFGFHKGNTLYKLVLNEKSYGEEQIL